MCGHTRLASLASCISVIKAKCNTARSSGPPVLGSLGPGSSVYSLHLRMQRDFAMPVLSCACLCNNSNWCLPFVSPSSCTVLLLWCFLLNITACSYCGINRWAYLQEKATLCNNFIQKREVGIFSRVGLFLEDYGS